MTKTPVIRLISIVAVLSAMVICGNIASLYVASQNADESRDKANGALVNSIRDDFEQSAISRVRGLATDGRLFDEFNSNTGGHAVFAKSCAKDRSLQGVATLAIAERAGNPIALCEYGQMKPVAEHAYLIDHLGPLIDELYPRIAADQIRFERILHEFFFHKDYVSIGDRVYLAVTTLLTPAETKTLVGEYTPKFAVFLTNVEKTLVAQLNDKLPIKPISMKKSGGVPGFSDLAIRNDQGEMLAAITWPASTSFRGQLWDLIPSLALISIMVFLLIVRFLLRIRDLQKDLQLRTDEAVSASLHDNMTGLANRTKFNAELDLDVQRASASKPAFVGFLDLDHFKSINDTYGHDVGDEMIIEASKRLRGVVGKDNTAARLGGDEFAFIIRDKANEAELRALCDRIDEQIKVPFQSGDILLQPSASFGLAECPRHGRDPDAVLKAADDALYAAKNSGRGRYHIYSLETKTTQLDEIHSEMNSIPRTAIETEGDYGSEPVRIHA